MIRSVLSLAAAMTLTLAAPALAQTAEATPQAALEPETLEAGQTYIRETYTDWAIRCIRGTQTLANDSCQLYQLLQDGSGNPVSEFTLLPAPEGSDVSALVTVVTPLETLLTQGVVMAIDSDVLPPKPFVWCARTGCFSRFGITDDEVEKLKAGAVVTLSIVALANPQSRIEVQGSLRGFTAAFETLQEEVLSAAQ